MKKYDKKISIFIAPAGYKKMSEVLSGSLLSDGSIQKKKASQVLREAIERKHALIKDATPVPVFVERSSGNKGKIPRVFDVCNFHIDMLNAIIRHHYLHSRTDAVRVCLREYFEGIN